MRSPAVRHAAEGAGRDPATVTLGCGTTVKLTAERRDHPRHVLGTPAQAAERIHGFREVGFDHLEGLRFAPMRDPTGPSLERTLEMIELFAAEVAPAARP